MIPDKFSVNGRMHHQPWNHVHPDKLTKSQWKIPILPAKYPLVSHLKKNRQGSDAFQDKEKEFLHPVSPTTVSPKHPLWGGVVRGQIWWSNLEILSPPTYLEYSPLGECCNISTNKCVEKVSMDEKIAYAMESANVNVEMETPTGSCILSWE